LAPFAGGNGLKICLPAAQLPVNWYPKRPVSLKKGENRPSLYHPPYENEQFRRVLFSQLIDN
jgi:hypothetical protein